MSDIVERLAKWPIDSKTCQEAIDEIERLRAELKEYEKLGTAENIAMFLTQLVQGKLR